MRNRSMPLAWLPIRCSGWNCEGRTCQRSDQRLSGATKRRQTISHDLTIPMYNININRRNFLHGAAAALAFSALGARGIDLINPARPVRVGLIGAGWYGKSDLFRLIQVVPCEVVAICDVDRNMLSEAAKLVSQRQKSKKLPRQYVDY